MHTADGEDSQKSRCSCKSLASLERRKKYRYWRTSGAGSRAREGAACAGTTARREACFIVAGRSRRHCQRWPEPYRALGVGPYLNERILNWLENPPDSDGPIPEARRNFLTLAEAKTMPSRQPDLFAVIHGDLQMHTAWSDGSSSIQDMAEAAVALGYSFLAITTIPRG